MAMACSAVVMELPKGVFITTMIVNILFFAQIDPLFQTFYEGLFLLVAVIMANLISRLVRRR